MAAGLEPRRDALSFVEWFEWASAYVRAAGGDLARSSYRIDREGRTLFWQEHVAWEAHDSESLLPVAERRIIREWAERLSNRYFLCHAAALERQGEALLIVGTQGAGKTTLALALTRRGFGYLGDEFALVCPQTLEALPFPKALCIKDNGKARIGPTDPHFKVIPYPPGLAPRYEGAVCCLPRKQIVPAPGTRFPVRWLFFLDDKPAAGVLATVPRWQATMELYRSSWRTGEAAFRTAAALARKAQRCSLQRNNLEQMVESIESEAMSRRESGARITLPAN